MLLMSTTEGSLIFVSDVFSFIRHKLQWGLIPKNVWERFNLNGPL